jgi:hypothetical protein
MIEAHETSLSKLSDHDWQVLRSHWSMYSGFSFCRKLGRKWTVDGFGIVGPLFTTKGAAERYVSNLICAESRWRAAQRAEVA